MREGDWKLIEYFEDGRLELYNLGEDIGECRNLAEAEAEKARTLRDTLVRWRSETGAPVPTDLNPEYEGA